MAELIIATHGKMAGGTADAVELLAGKKKHLFILEAYDDNLSVEEKIEQLCRKLDPQQQWIFAVDLHYGSVAQALAIYFSGKLDQVKILADFNLSLILRLIEASSETVFTEDELRSLAEASRKDVILVNDLFQMSSDF